MKSITRRQFVNGSLCAGTALALRTPSLSAPAAKSDEDLLQWVDLAIGTGGHGHCFPGASLPFGAVQLSPDTYNEGWDWCSGYHFADQSIMGFSHTHLSGTGRGDLLDFLVMAGTGQARLEPGSREHPELGYRSRFDRRDEVKAPGYYSVRLKDYSIRAELTVTERVGFHRYTFPKNEHSYLILDLQHGYFMNGEPTVDSAELRRLNSTTLQGGRVTSAWGKGRHAYFTLQVSKAPQRVVFYSDDQPVEAPADRAGRPDRLQGKNLKCVLSFATEGGETIGVKVGISAVSADGAAHNIQREAPGWDFDAIRQNAQEIWRRQLGKIRIETSSREHKRIFYSSLYHLSLGPTRFDDADGRYRGMDGEVHSLSPQEQNYTTFSLWDTYRAAHPLYTLIERPRVRHFVNTLVRMAVESPEGMPVWPLHGCETGTMTGYHSAAVIAEACNKRIAGIDYEKAYACMMKRAMKDDYRGLPLYRKLGFIPADCEPESVSKAFEYCYDDWAVSNVALALNKSSEAEMLKNRSTNYRFYFDPAVTFMRPKLENGAWAEPFTPMEMGHSKTWRDYTESNPWQTTFSVQHDPAGLIRLFGGATPFVKKLDEIFTTSSELPPDAPADIAGLVGQYAHGNEPSHHIAYLYVYAGQPGKTQARIRSLLETMYSAHPDGLQGNEDVGQMSAWYVLSALGFYPVDPVSGNYVLGTPLFDRATVQLDNGRTLDIRVHRESPSQYHVREFVLNGKPQQRAWFNHAEIAEGGTIDFTLGNQPSETLGTARESLPSSLT